MSQIDYKDKETWDLFCEGRTKGIFQLESQLGRTWAKRIAPRNLEELSALIALIRPGCLKAIIDGKSMTQHYVDRKKGEEDVTYLHPSLESILEKTFGVLVYQEQSMLIARKLAGFNLKEADELRKAIGKKKADVMAKVKIKFIEGCERVGMVDAATAAEIFGWIEKSSRYAFNKSHSVSYAKDSFNSAWDKAKHTTEFFVSYLTFAHEKQDPQQEVYELVSEAKLFDIEMRMPNLSFFPLKFEEVNGNIYFGIKDIKSLSGITGDRVFEAIRGLETNANGSGRSYRDFTWIDVLIHISPLINATSFKTLASVGFFSTKSTGITRNRALYEYMIYNTLTKGEQQWIAENYSTKQWKSLKECFIDLAPKKKNGGGAHNDERSLKIENEIYFIDHPPYDLEDDPAWIIDQEIKFLGCPISLARVEAVDTSASNTSCKDIINGKTGDNICVVGNVTRIGAYNCKRGKFAGQPMAFLTIEDETCAIDNVVVFPECRKAHNHLLYEGANLLFCGEIQKGDNSFIIKKIHEIL